MRKQIVFCAAVVTLSVVLELSIGTSLFGLASSKGVVKTSQHDVALVVNRSQTVEFSVTFPNKSNGIDSTITFFSTPPGVVSLEPDQVTIHPDESSFKIKIIAEDAGKTVVTANATESSSLNVQDAFVRVTSQHSEGLDTFSQIIGWIYFVAWSISFYPQIYENWKRKSVIGLSFDFLGLNVVGFTMYSLFNIGLYWVPGIQAEYFSRHPTGVNPVQLNDVIFSLHAVFACVVTIAQCIIYERGTQAVSRICKILLGAIALLIAISLILSFASVLKYLDFLYICSYVKLFITLVKYVPQAYLNWRRKSTMGWSIGNIILDFTGGILSIGQMFVISYNENDWGSIFGDPTKFGLGLFSVLFDIVFIVQHYVLYRNRVPSEELINEDEDVAEPPLDENEDNSDQEIATTP